MSGGSELWVETPVYIAGAMASEGLEPTADQLDDHDRNLLNLAVSVAQHELSRTGDPVVALSESFTHARRGLGAQIALLLYVRQNDPINLEILFSSGLSWEQQEACRSRRSVEGVSPSVIQEAIDRKTPIFIANSQATGDTARTASLAGDPRSVLCAPILDPYTGAVIAVLYLQNKGLARAFDDDDHAWLASYSVAIGWGFGQHLASKRRISELEEEKRRLLRDPSGAPEIIGDSPSTKGMLSLLDETFIPATARANPRPILILGDSGTGKELVARYLHYYSPTRGRGPFVTYNCAGLRGDMMMAQSVLFGHRRGSFTGAVRDTPGLFRAAHKGVLFLDEVGELSSEAQALLLRVLETRAVQPVGEIQGEPVDVQLVLATHRELPEEVAAGRFRNDLWSRIGGLKLRLSSLGASERRGDIRPLLSYFISRHEKDLKKKTAGLTPEALTALLCYQWPNNVREVDNVCMALVTYAKPGARIDRVDIERICPEVIHGPRRPDAAAWAADTATYDDAFRYWETEFLRQRIEQHGGNMKEAARVLGVSDMTFLRYRRRCGLVRKEDEGAES